MAKFYSCCAVTVRTLCEDGAAVPNNVPADVEYRVRDLGRGLWSVQREDGYRYVLRTAALQRFFRPEAYVSGYYSSGEPVRVYEKVYITRT